MFSTIRVVVVAVLAVALALPSASPALADHAQPVKLVGMATAGSDFRTEWPEIEAQSGRLPAVTQLFWRIDDGSDGQEWPNTWADNMLADVHRLGSVPYVELSTTHLARLASGELAELGGFVSATKEFLAGGEGRYLLVAPLPEANLDEHPWSGDPARYKEAFARIRHAFKTAGLDSDKVRFVFSMNGLSTAGFDYRQFYPGDAAVDLIGFSKLNRGGSAWRAYATTFQMHIDEMRQKISRTKPLLITQTGSVETGGNRAGWLHDMFTKLKAHPQVVGFVYWNRATTNHDFRVYEDGTLDPTFRDDMQTWSPPSEHAWLFDGRMDSWVTAHGGTPSQRFGDIGGSPFTTELEWLADSGITGGCAPDRFCPTSPVTRAQMATFLARALGLAEANEQRFSDVPPSHPHFGTINAIADAGIAGGYPDGTFRPDLVVNREQMATFLAKAYDLPPQEGQDTFVDDQGSAHEPNIERLVGAGITGGCSADGRFFCPTHAVTRQQMAAFLFRAEN